MRGSGVGGIKGVIGGRYDYGVKDKAADGGTAGEGVIKLVIKK